MAAPTPSQPWGLFYGFQGQRLSFESLSSSWKKRAREMLGPNRNLVGAGVGHVEEDSITAWWFRNPAITSWYGKFIPVFTGFFRGDHNLRPYILRDIPEFFAIQTWSLSYFFVKFSWHGPMADLKISGSILAGTLWLCFSSMTAPAEMLWGSQVWVVFGSDEAWEGDNSNRFFECHCWWLKSPTTTTVLKPCI